MKSTNAADRKEKRQMILMTIVVLIVAFLIGNLPRNIEFYINMRDLHLYTQATRANETTSPKIYTILTCLEYNDDGSYKGFFEVSVRSDDWKKVRDCLQSTVHWRYPVIKQMFPTEGNLPIVQFDSMIFYPYYYTPGSSVYLRTPGYDDAYRALVALAYELHEEQADGDNAAA